MELDSDGNIYLTYFDSADPGRCLLRWTAADGYKNYEVLGHGSELCASGDHSNGPHGLRIAKEADGTFFYHANNNQALFKTTLEGKVLWSVYGPPKTGPDLNESKMEDAHSRKPGTCVHGKYCPTWFGQQPGSENIYMADGYGSDEIHLFTRHGKYTGHTVGGTSKGTPPQKAPHGKFNIPHSISW